MGVIFFHETTFLQVNAFYHHYAHVRIYNTYRTGREYFYLLKHSFKCININQFHKFMVCLKHILSQKKFSVRKH